jgi:hypothetical protein
MIAPVVTESARTGIANPVEARSSTASISPVRATSASAPTTIDDVESSVNGSPSFRVSDTGAGTMLWTIVRVGSAPGGRRAGRQAETAVITRRIRAATEIARRANRAKPGRWRVGVVVR